MSPSPSMEQVAADIAELKRAALQTVEILVDHSNRLDRVERSINAMERSVDARCTSLEGRFDAVTERLDRLLALSLAERTVNAERLGAIDHRLDRVEHRLERLEERLP